MVENTDLNWLNAEIVAALFFVAAVVAETLHAKRIGHLSRLAFGDRGKPSAWVRFAPIIRSLSIAAVAWGLVSLVICDPRSYSLAGSVPPGKEQHMIVVLDVSPSMRLPDAGPRHNQTRRERARDIMRSFFGRIPIEKYLVSVVAVYNGAKPVVVDSRDMAVVDGILGDIPLYQAFKSGQTKLLDGLAEAAKIAKPWNPGSTTVILVSDGDTVPGQGMPAVPVSVGNVLVVGVGDPSKGTFIDGRQSKQDVFSMKQIAARLRGTYHDGNAHHLPSSVVGSILKAGDSNLQKQWGKREYALLLIGFGSVVLAILPISLQRLGTAHRPGIRHRTFTRWQKLDSPFAMGFSRVPVEEPKLVRG